MPDILLLSPSSFNKFNKTQALMSDPRYLMYDVSRSAITLLSTDIALIIRSLPMRTAKQSTFILFKPRFYNHIPSFQYKPSSNFLSDRSKAALLLWILFVICIRLSHTALSVSCGLEATCVALRSPVRRGNVFLCFCHFPIWCLGSGVVLDCIDS